MLSASSGSAAAAARTVAEAFCANLLLQPATVRRLVRDWAAQFMPMESILLVASIDDGARRAESPRAAFDLCVRAFFLQLATMPGDLRLRGQAAAMATKSALEPRPVFVLSLAPNRLSVSDETLLRAGWPVLINCLGAMCAAPEHCWANVAAGDMRGHTVAELFRWPAMLARFYSPVYMLCYACQILLLQHAAACADAGLDAVQAAAPNFVLRSVLACAVEAAPLPPPDRQAEHGLRRALIGVLRDGLHSADSALAAITTAVANLDDDMLAHYAHLRLMRSMIERQTL